VSILLRRIIICCVGLLAGIAAWPVVELVLAAQESFPSYLSFGATLGAVLGVILGGLFGAAEGITSNVKSRIPAGLSAGLIMGALGGAVGFLVGQGLFLVVANAFLETPEQFGPWGLLGARAFGWAVLGAFVGMGEGLRAASGRKIVTGVLGGVIGGLIGGVALEYSQVFLPSLVLARMAGLAAFGLLVGVAYAVVERQMSRGLFLVLNGPLKGREFVVNQNRMRLGTAMRSEIRLQGYRGVAAVHAQLRASGRDLLIQKREKVVVNDQSVKEHRFKYEDVVKIGSARLYYRPE
jgi:hypothetical protein